MTSPTIWSRKPTPGPDDKGTASNGQVLEMRWGTSAGNFVQNDQVAFGWTGVSTTLQVHYANAIGHPNTMQVYVDG